MSVMFARKTSTSKRPSLKCSDIASRDMTRKRKVHRKVGEMAAGGKPQRTKTWDGVTIGADKYNISFSRDNMQVWINDAPVESKGYITDAGYDVDLFFNIGSYGCHIYSDVEGHEMVNYLCINDEIVDCCYNNLYGDQAKLPLKN